MNQIGRLLLIGLLAGLAGCKREAAETTSPTRATADSSAAPAKLKEAKAAPADHGEPIPLGSATIGDYEVRASRDKAEIKAGSDAPIDVWLTGDITKVQAVRFWIGTASGAESIKALAGIENKSEPNHWHTHAEIPDPIPAGSRLWVEIETRDSMETAAYELKG